MGSLCTQYERAQSLARVHLRRLRETRYLTGWLGDDISALCGRRVVFAPHWAAPDRIVHALKRGVPLWVIGLVFVLFALLAFIGLRWVLERQTQTAQGDAHHGAAHTWASVSGKTTSWYTHEGRAKVYAANGAVTLRAHTDELQILADKDVTIISVNARRAVHRDLR